MFSALIDVAGQSKQLDMALYLLTEMRVAGVPIGTTTYGALIGIFGKVGSFKSAWSTCHVAASHILSKMKASFIAGPLSSCRGLSCQMRYM